VATYAAVVSALPSGRHLTLQSFLSALNSDQLRLLAERMGVRPLSNLKAERMKAILVTGSNPAFIRQRIEMLSPEAREIFENIRAAGGLVRTRDLQDDSGYDLWPQYPSWKGAPLTPLHELANGCLLVSADYQYGPPSARLLAIPQEVEEAISPTRPFDGPLQLPSLQAAADVTPGRVPTPTLLVRDLGHLLGFIGAGHCEWRQDGLPYQRSMQTLAKALGTADTDYAGFLYFLAQSVDMLEERWQAPPVVSRKLAKAEPSKWLELALRRWSGEENERWFASAGRTRPRARLVEFVAHCPADVWVLKESFVACLEFLWPLVFNRTGGSDDEALWSDAARLILGFGVTADGKETVLIPSSVQQLLSGRDDSESQTGVLTWEERCTVLPDRSLIAAPNAHPALLVSLWRIADLESCQGASIFRLTPDSVRRALNRGLTPTEVQSLLVRISDGPLPQTVTRLVEDQQARYGLIKVGTARAYLRIEDSALLEETLNHPKLRHLQWNLLAPGIVSTRSMEQDDLLNLLRSAGYLPAADSAPRRNGPRRAGGRPRKEAKSKEKQ
jgi:hypothetical protein